VVAEIADLVEMPMSTLSDDEVVRLLDTVTQLRARVDAVVCRVAVEADRRRLAERNGHRSTTTWWAHRSRLTRGEAGRLLGLGQRLDTDLLAPVASALGDGRLCTDQAGVIVRAVDGLPSDLDDAAMPAKVRDLLLGEAAHHDARALRILGKRALDVIDPEAGERHEQRLLEAEEARAAARARFTMVDDGHGQCHGRFSIPSYHGQLLRSHLLALADPRRRRSEESPRAITPDSMGQALMEYVERYPAAQLPTHGGATSSLTVTVDLDTLASGLGVASLSSGGRISAGEARRLACHAGLVPMVLGGASRPLDVGRSRRLFIPAQRRALDVRDGGCTAEGCGLPPQACHAHHDEPWAAGGPTDLAQGRLLCPRHHRLAHDRRYEMSAGSDRMVTFHRRT
jgi:hypothetical protein